MTTLNTKDIALIAILSAILSLASYALILPFLFIVLALSLKRNLVLYIALITALIIYIIWGFLPNTLSNFILLPMIAVMIEKSTPWIYTDRQNWQETTTTQIKLAAVSFVIILLTNYLNTLGYGLIVGSPIALFIQTFFNNLFSAAINAVLIFLFAAPLRKLVLRLVKQLKK